MELDCDAPHWCVVLLDDTFPDYIAELALSDEFDCVARDAIIVLMVLPLSALYSNVHRKR